jgi:hypothetical protein
MDESKDSYKREYRRISIRTSDGSTLVGKVNIGIKERVSDLFTKTENPFIVIIDVEHQDIQGRVLFVNKNNIVWVETLTLTHFIFSDRCLDPDPCQ